MKALFFGSIGTLVNSSALQLEAFNRAFSEVGLDWHWNESRYRDMLRSPGGRDRVKTYADSLGEPVTDALASRVHDLKTDIFNRLLQGDEVKPRPGVRRLLAEARHRGLKLGFITTTERRNVEAIARVLGNDFSLADFDIVTDRDIVSAGKPEPEAYRVALNSLGIKADEALAVEDTAVCSQAAIAADIACIVTPNEFAPREAVTGALATLDHLGDEDNPARLIDGASVLIDGQVTIESLQAVMNETA